MSSPSKSIFKRFISLFPIFLLGAVVAIAVHFLFPGRKAPEPVDAPLLPRASHREDAKNQFARATDLLDWGRTERPVTFVNVPRDALPNGLALSMVPLIVDWNESPWEEADGYFTVHNVNVGGNPVKGTALLATVRIPTGGIQSVEFLLARDRKGEKENAFGHGQIRFIFKETHLPKILNPFDMPERWDPYLDDIIVSWEAWREPRGDYTFADGLKTEGAYALTVRCFSGAQRFLVEGLKNKVWESYPLELPEVENAGDKILYASLLYGDGLARRMAQRMVQEGDLEVTNADLVGFSEDDLNQVKAVFGLDDVPDDPLEALMGEADLSYNLILRSCITQAITTIDLAYERIYAENDLGERKRPKIAPAEMPGWIDELADKDFDLSRALTHLPAAIYWVAKNQTVLPAQSYRILDDAGMLQRKDGEPVKYVYTPEGVTPYGHLKDTAL